MRFFSLPRIAALMLSAAIFAPSVNAVTDKEMDEARAITAMAYLRYANDGSGYLDELPAPKSMADLRKGLKKQEIENLKSFEAVKAPAGYASWDKSKLVEYWSSTFFSSPGLIEKGKLAKARVRKRVDAMTVSAAVAKAEPAPAKETPVEAAEPTPADEAVSEVPAGTISVSDSIEAVANEIEETMTREVPEKKSESHTWVYVMILCILVAVVVALVIFASNVMKRSGNNAPSALPSGGISEDEADRREEAIREKFASTLAAKNEEIKKLQVRVETLETENSALMKENATLRKEMETRKVTERDEEVARPVPPRPAATTRSIYLGRVNSRGLFVRADRKLSVGHSLYRLDTTDGFSGTFRVAEDPTVWEMALLTPRDSLSGACTGKDLEDTEGYTRIVTESAGTAIFEDGCWKVIRKAKIRYE